MVPNVARAIVCASDSVGTPLTICSGRNSTRISSSALTHDCAAMKCATAIRQLLDPRDLVRLGTALRTRTSTLFEGIFEPAARPPKQEPPLVSKVEPTADPISPGADPAGPIAEPPAEPAKRDDKP